MRDFNGVIQHILAVTCAITHAAEQLDNFGVQVMNAGFQHGAFAFGFDCCIDFALSFGNHFLDSGRVNPPVLNQLFKGKPCNFTANGIKTGYGNGFRCVINNQIAPGKSFDAADVTSFTADDAAFHLIVGERNNRNGDFAGMVSSAALDRCRDNLFGEFICIIFHLLFNFLDLHGHFMRTVILDGVDQINLCFFSAEAGDFFQHLQLALFQGCNFLLLLFDGSDFGIERIRLLLNGVSLAVERFLLLLQAVFLLFQLGTALLFFPFIFGTVFVYFFLCLQESLLFLALRTFY